MSLRALHRSSAVVIGLFALVHIANHLWSLTGVHEHIAFMEVARKVYRQPVAESLLLFCVAFQMGSGFWLVVRGWKQRAGAVAWLQALSGCVLALFLAIHVSAVLIGRTVLELDTNFYYAAAGMHVSPYEFFFAPYYFLAVFALFTHLGCAAYGQLQSAPVRLRRLAMGLPMLVGAAVSTLLVLSLAGRWQPLEVPARYKATYARQEDPSVKGTCLWQAPNVRSATSAGPPQGGENQAPERAPPANRTHPLPPGGGRGVGPPSPVQGFAPTSERSIPRERHSDLPPLPLAGLAPSVAPP
ncbi:hypothetical protein BURK2_02843 [Burkholderiales bacterium]|nr:hypothetical protein BURK2_02843 [Burkholderiales bacterium]